VCTALVLISCTAHAERIEPPLELLHDPTNLVVAGTIETVDSTADRVVFQRKDLLAGRAALAPQDDEVEVRVPHEALGHLAVGKDYIFAYTLFAPDPRRPGKLLAKRQGATVLVAPGLEPAVFEDTPDVRRLLDLGNQAEGEDSAELLELLLHNLAGKNPALQNLAANELALAPELRQRLGPPERKTIRTFVDDPAAAPLGRMALLEAAAQFPQNFGAGWALDSAARILASAPTSGVENGDADRATLLRSTLLLFDQTTAVSLSPQTVRRWLGSDSVALVEPSLRLLQRQAPQTARRTIEQVASDAGTPAQTRIFLREYLKRFDASRARGGASG